MENRKLRVDLYGNVRILFGDEDITGRVSKKSMGVIAFLLSSPEEAVSKNTLKNLFWIDAGDKASYNLRFNLWNIKKSVPEIEGETLILSDRNRCMINPEYPVEKGTLSRIYEGASIDMEECLGEILKLKPTQLTFMENFALKDSDEFNDWLILERNRRERKLVQFLYGLADYLEARGRHQELLEILGRISFLSPFEDDVCIRVMKTYYRQGNPGKAMAEYRRYVSLLRKELGVEPSKRVMSCRDMIAGERAEDNDDPMTVTLSPGNEDFSGALELLEAILANSDRRVRVCADKTDRKSAELFERFEKTGLIEVRGGQYENKS